MLARWYVNNKFGRKRNKNLIITTFYIRHTNMQINNYMRMI